MTHRQEPALNLLPLPASAHPDGKPGVDVGVYLWRSPATAAAAEPPATDSAATRASKGSPARPCHSPRQDGKSNARDSTDPSARKFRTRRGRSYFSLVTTTGAKLTPHQRRSAPMQRAPDFLQSGGCFARRIGRCPRSWRFKTSRVSRGRGLMIDSAPHCSPLTAAAEIRRH